MNKEAYLAGYMHKEAVIAGTAHTAYTGAKALGPYAKKQIGKHIVKPLVGWTGRKAKQNIIDPTVEAGANAAETIIDERVMPRIRAEMAGMASQFKPYAGMAAMGGLGMMGTNMWGLLQNQQMIKQLKQMNQRGGPQARGPALRRAPWAYRYQMPQQGGAGGQHAQRR